jgi:hypothetical protein
MAPPILIQAMLLALVADKADLKIGLTLNIRNSKGALLSLILALNADRR